MYAQIGELNERQERVETEDEEKDEVNIQPVIQNKDTEKKTHKHKTRSVYKHGSYNVRSKHTPQNDFVIHMQDIFTSLVESRWRVTLLVFSFSFLATWLLFGVLWWCIAHGHGDLFDSENFDPDREPCVTEVRDFVSAFLFSLETQYSTGYGSRSPTTKCPDAILLLVVQSIFGVLIQSTMAGIVFAKLSRPKARSQHIVFSKKAVLCVRDGRLSLMFRVGDFRKSHIVGATLRAYMLRHRVTAEGEVLPHFQHSLRLYVDDGGSDAFLIWPSTVLHRIDESSPLFDIAQSDLASAQFEIVVVLNGTVEATGQTTEAKMSYLPSEILWGHRFKQLMKYYRKRRYDFAVDYSRFDETYAVATPPCCARDLPKWIRGDPETSRSRNSLVTSSSVTV